MERFNARRSVLVGPRTRRGAERAWRVLVGLAVAALTLAAVGASSAFADDEDAQTVLVFTHFQDDGNVTPSTLPCQGGQAIHGYAKFGLRTGDTWKGTSEYDICLKPGPTPDTLTFHGVETFTGTVTGCGTGTMTYTLTHGFVRLEANPTTPNGTQVWQIVPGTGTGELAGVTGGLGVSVFTILPTLANDGFFTGTLTCQRD